MKKLISAILILVIVVSICSFAFSEVDISPITGIWVRESEYSTDIFFIRDNYLKMISLFEISYERIVGDAVRPNVFYLISDDFSLYELTLSEDGNSFIYRIVSSDTTPGVEYTRFK